MPTPSASPPVPRAAALDAVRGLAILLMVFSGRIPFGVLPDWMYHAQVPPPGHRFDPPLAGITWVDLVFPFFLFSMGAAIPLALSRRLRAGTPFRSMAGGILARGLLLAAFAIYVMHIRPWAMEDPPGTPVLLYCLAGFLLLFPMYMRFPGSWKKETRWVLRAAGWVGAAVLMALFRAKDGTRFSLERSDIIIRALWLFAVVQLVSIFGFAWLAWIGRNEAGGAAQLAQLALVIGFEALGVGLGTVAFVGFIARATNPAYTATQYALFSSLSAVPRTFVNAATGWLVEGMGWFGFFLLCALLAVPGMLLLVRVAPWKEASKEARI